MRLRRARAARDRSRDGVRTRRSGGGGSHGNARGRRRPDRGRHRRRVHPRWTHSRHVGDVDHYTLENVVIDNYFFGVAAVAKDGTESPVVFPGAGGSFGGY